MCWQTAAEQIKLDEAETRALIDEQLRERGWETDTQKLRARLKESRWPLPSSQQPTACRLRAILDLHWPR